MNLTNIKTTTTQILVFVFLFNIFSPAALALVEKNQNNGHFSIVCSLEGYKKIWINSNTENNNTNNSVVSCPYCLTNYDTNDILLSVVFVFGLQHDNGLDTTINKTIVSINNISNLTTIRSPPSIT